MAKFRCHKCGELHDEYPDLGFSAPDYFLALTEDERRKRADLTEDTCSIDDHCFIRGSLELPIVGQTGYFSYGVWISVSQTDFNRYHEHLADNRKNIGDRYVGYLSNSIPDYRDTLKLRAAAHVRSDLRPFIELQPMEHPLARLQRAGMSLERLSEIVAAFIH